MTTMLCEINPLSLTDIFAAMDIPNLECEEDGGELGLSLDIFQLEE